MTDGKYISHLKTFFARDSRGDCPEGSTGQTMQEVPACSIYCPGVDYDSAGKYPCGSNPDFSFDAGQKSFTYKGAPLTDVGFEYIPRAAAVMSNGGNPRVWQTADDGAEDANCYSDDYTKGKDCVLTDARKELWIHKDNGVAPTPLPPFLYDCKGGACLPDYGGRFGTLQDCQNGCTTPEPPAGGNKTLPIVLGAAGGLILLAALALMIYYFVGKKKLPGV